MSICLSAVFPQDSLSFGAKKSIQQIPLPNLSLSPRFPLSTVNYSFCFHSCLPLSTSVARKSVPRSLHCAAAANNSDSAGNIESDSASKAETQINHPLKKSKGPQTELNNDAGVPPTTIPKKPRRGRRSEAVAVEDFVRDSLEKTFASIREKNPDVFTRKEQIFKKVRDKAVSDVSAEEDDNDDDDDDYNDNRTEKQMVVDDEDPNWPADADVGWGIRASDYFEQHAIKNVVGDDGLHIDWEGEIDDTWIQEINCLEWESFAFHPSPLIVLVFERYNRAADNWKLLKELEKAFLVYWNAKDRLPPRAVKLDINIERDLAYALKVKQCPQILFLRGQQVLYREKELRTADELVQMIAYFYYKARKPAWLDDEALAK